MGAGSSAFLRGRKGDDVWRRDPNMAGEPSCGLVYKWESLVGTMQLPFSSFRDSRAYAYHVHLEPEC